MKKIFKILTICMMIIVLMQSIILSADGSIDTDYEIGNTPAIHASDKIIERVVGRIQVVGSVISVVALVIIGFRYMFSSVEEQAKVKGVMIYYIIGAVLVFATSNLLGIAYKIISGLTY